MAVSAARLGAQSGFIGKIGLDSFGKDFVRLLRREGVNADGVLYSDELPTAVGIIIFSTRGTNAIVIDMAANAAFLPEDVEAQHEIIAASDVIISPLEIPLESARAPLGWLAKQVRRPSSTPPRPQTFGIPTSVRSTPSRPMKLRAGFASA